MRLRFVSIRPSFVSIRPSSLLRLFGDEYLPLLGGGGNLVRKVSMGSLRLPGSALAGGGPLGGYGGG